MKRRALVLALVTLPTVVAVALRGRGVEKEPLAIDPDGTSFAYVDGWIVES